MIRIITSCCTSFEMLIKNGVFYKNRRYKAIPSRPPPPLPIPCSKCSSFSHTTENCNEELKCEKCHQPHHTSRCTSEPSPMCFACGANDHTVWSIKCNKRPTQPIQGIPNIKILCTNKKTHEIDTNITNNSRIHKPISIHDHIINTISTKINKPKNSDREALLKKLRSQFIIQYEIDVQAVFFGNKMYIIMEDTLNPNQPPPTQPKDNNITSVQINN